MTSVGLLVAILAAVGVADGAPVAIVGAVDGHRLDGLVSSVVRKPGLSDTIFPAVCPPSCAHLFRAIEQQVNTSLNNKCACVCPPEQPVYIASEGFCAAGIADFRHMIRWNSTSSPEAAAPVATLSPHAVLLPDVALLWQDAQIPVSASGQLNCSVTRVVYENLRHRWKTTTKRNLFELTTLHHRPALLFRGTETDALGLAGSVVQLRLSCARGIPDDHFILLRVAGVSGTEPMSTTPGPDQLQMTIVFSLTFFVVVTLIVTFVVWNVCWKIKKRKLISDFQMQFIYHFRQQQEVQKMALESSLDPTDNDASLARLQTARRGRLIFNSEFLDREHLENPPPMAEQFLNDLRRTIDVAKDRIRQRRFVPMLIAIPEALEENRFSYIAGDIDDDEYDDDVVVAFDASQESPRSESKSVDSGRESRDNSDDSGSSRDDDDDDDSDDMRKAGDGSGSRVSNIVSVFENRSRPSQLPVPSQQRKAKPSTPTPQMPKSRLPTPIGHPSPRPHTRCMSVSVAAPVTANMGDDVDDEDTSMSVAATTTAIPQVHAPVWKTPTTAGGYQGRSLRERKGYAVFPSDGTFNKSLPRRPKRVGAGPEG